MTTFLWMLYLAVTIFCSIIVLTGLLSDAIHNKLAESLEDTTFYLVIVTPCILWSIWYFYYLH